LKLLDPLSASEFQISSTYHIDQAQKLLIPEITDSISELKKLANACGPLRYQTTIAATGAQSIISMVESKPPHILFDTNGDVLEGNFAFSVQIGLKNFLKVKPFEIKFNLTLKPCLVESISQPAMTVLTSDEVIEIAIPDF